MCPLMHLMAMVVLYLNIKRQKTNQDYYDRGYDNRVSGVVFLFSIFIWIGVATSPLSFNPFWLLTLIFEIHRGERCSKARWDAIRASLIGAHFRILDRIGVTWVFENTRLVH